MFPESPSHIETRQHEHPDGVHPDFVTDRRQIVLPHAAAFQIDNDFLATLLEVDELFAQLPDKLGTTDPAPPAGKVGQIQRNASDLWVVFRLFDLLNQVNQGMLLLIKVLGFLIGQTPFHIHLEKGAAGPEERLCGKATHQWTVTHEVTGCCPFVVLVIVRNHVKPQPL